MYGIATKKIDEDNYKKDRNICKNCYNMNKKTYNKNTFSRKDNNKKKRRNNNSVNNAKDNKRKKKQKLLTLWIIFNNQTHIIGFSIVGKLI